MISQSIYNPKAISLAKKRKKKQDIWATQLGKVAELLEMDGAITLDRVYLKVRAVTNTSAWVEKDGQKKKLVKKYLSDSKKTDFYSSQKWRELRYDALNKYGKKCSCCGSTEELHVDHIKPRSKYPELELDIGNLQILCKDCNLGKLARDEIKHR